MQKALETAQKSGADMPIGAVIVKNREIIAFSHNEKEQNNNPIHHAEILAITKACELLGTWRLEDCDMYVTLEPCPMCAWAIINSRIKNVYFASYDNLYGALGSKIDLRKLVHSKLNVQGGILEKECNNVIKSYFEGIRK